jgi:hypothetical protein
MLVGATHAHVWRMADGEGGIAAMRGNCHWARTSHLRASLCRTLIYVGRITSPAGWCGEPRLEAMTSIVRKRGPDIGVTVVLIWLEASS